ncbi:MAG: hypothetical protein V4631_20890 [Pseudomonadota bacterium]
MSFTYEQARPHIADGDIIEVRETHGFLTPFTKFFTRSAYTHTGSAFWGVDGGLWMSEMNGGKNHAIPLSQLSETDFDVYYRPEELDPARVRASILDHLRVKIPYGAVALFFIGFLNFFRIKAFIHWRKLLVCSGYTVADLEGAGWPECTRILSPDDLSKKLKLKMQVRREKT